MRTPLAVSAEREHIAVSAASKRVPDLEAALGARPLHRPPRGVEPTPAGSALLHHATVILRGLERLEGDLRGYARGVKGHVWMSYGDSCRGVLDVGPGETADAPRAEVARSALAGVAPRAARIDHDGLLPADLWRKMGDLGVLGITVEEEYSGAGMG